MKPTLSPSIVEYWLMSFAFKERTGRELRELYERTRKLKISDGTLYVTLGRLKKKGWLTAREAEDRDGRLRYFQITGLGQKVWSNAKFEFAVLGRVKGARS